MSGFLKNITTLPSFAISHFSKFHLTSEPCFGSQRQLFDGQNSSHGAGHIFCIAKTTKFYSNPFFLKNNILTFKQLKMGCDFFPFTSIFFVNGKNGQKLYPLCIPGLTQAIPKYNSVALAAGSCLANWLHGKPCRNSKNISFFYAIDFPSYKIHFIFLPTQKVQFH